MADENNNSTSSDFGDILGSVSHSRQNDSYSKKYQRNARNLQDSVQSIDNTTKSIHKDILKLIDSNKNSNSTNFRNAINDAAADRRSNTRETNGNHSFTSSAASSVSGKYKNSVKSNVKVDLDPSKFLDVDMEGVVKDAFDGFEETLCDYLGIPFIDKKFKDKVNKSFKDWSENLAEALNVEVDDLCKTVVSQVTAAELENHPRIAKSLKKVTDWYKNGFDDLKNSAISSWDAAVANMQTEEFKGRAATETQEGFTGLLTSDNLFKKREDSASEQSSTSNNYTSKVKDKFVDEAKDTAKQSTVRALQTGDVTELVKGLKGVAGSFVKVGPQLIATAAVTRSIDLFTESITDFMSSASKAIDKLSSGASNWEKTQWANTEAQEKRFKSDVETYIKTPFQILEDAANKVYEVWDSALQTINATQGYTKSDLQDLMTAYATRLRTEGLSDVVGTTDVTAMLQSIISQGLSGKVAEEFAYQATILKKAIPTEDFTSYAASYASLASQYMALGHSQEEALEYANDQLQLFASNILNASRQVSGGFTTSLTGVSNLFSDIVKISETAGSTDTASLSSALSIVQAVAGRVSPDVGNSLVSQIVNAAIGGNDNSLVALRSLAGTGASNTAFLKALANDPNTVLANMFSGLQNMFDKTTDNYMEVAYSLADTFGVSADALARIDWQSLVSELKNNSASNTALNQNMELLASGETTTSAESQRLAQINQYMIDQGLSYVLDNEAARQIQQHMWDQEIAAQLQESTYAVDFAGGALELITSIKTLIGNVLRVLSLGAVDVARIATTARESSNLKSDIESLVQAGKVGNGNTQAYHDLVTYDVTKLNQVPNLLSIWGKGSLYYGTGSQESGLYQFNSKIENDISSPTGKYTWADASKSTLSAINSYHPQKVDLPGISAESASETISSEVGTKFSKWIDNMDTVIKDGKSYQDWYNSASDYGFSDASAAITDAGYTEQDMQDMYLDKSTDVAVNQAVENKQLEMQFYQSGITWFDSIYPADKQEWNTKYDTNVTSWFDTFTTQMGEWSTLYTNTMTAFTEHLDATYEAWSTLYTEYTDETHKNQKYLNNKFDESFINDFLYEWKDYYIGDHTHYREATNFDSSLRTINTEKSQTGEAVLALAQTLTKNYEDLADPAVQTNVLLGQVVILLQSILTAQTSSAGLTLPTSLAALGLNITKTS